MSTTYTDLTETQFPDKVDDLSRMSDLTVSDVALVNQYYTYYNAGNLAAAAQLLIDNPTLMNKIFNAAKFNILRDALIALQRYYKSDVQTYIDSTRESLQGEINTFVPMGTYSSSTSYVKNNIVTYSGNGYICKQSCKGKTPGTTAGADYWQLIASKGDKGDSGTGLTFRGTYSSTTAYTKDDSVTDGHAIWAALKASTGQTLVEGEYWTKAIDIDVAFDEHNTASNAHENRFSQIAQQIQEAIESIPEITIDTAMSSESKNPVQNKVVKEALDGKVSLSGGTMTGVLKAYANTQYTTYQVRNIALNRSASTPTNTGNILGVYS